MGVRWLKRSSTPRERSPIAKKYWLPMSPRNFGSHVTVRPPTLPHHSETNVKCCTFLLGWEPVTWYCTFLLWSILTAVKMRYEVRWPISHDRIAQLSSRDGTSFELTADKFLMFNWSQAELQLDFVIAMFFSLNGVSPLASAESMYYRCDWCWKSIWNACFV